MPLYLVLAALGLVGFGVYEMFQKSGGAGASPGGGGGGALPPGVPAPPFDLSYPGAGAWQSNSAFIKQYQGALTYLAFKTGNASWDPGGIDGQYGPKTAAAVKAFESANGLTADGECGEQCTSALQNVLTQNQAAGFRGIFPGRADDHMGQIHAVLHQAGARFRGTFHKRAEDLVGKRLRGLFTRPELRALPAGRADDHMGGVGRPMFVGTFPGRGNDHMGGVGRPMFVGTFPGRGDDHMGLVPGPSFGPACNWQAMTSAPANLKAAVLATLRAMRADASIPYGESVHEVNGILVKFDKHLLPNRPLQLGPVVVAVAYCPR